MKAQKMRPARRGPRSARFLQWGAGLVLMGWLGGAAAAGIDIPAGSSVDFDAGSVDFGCTGVSVLGTVNGGSATLTGIGDVAIGGGGTVAAGAGRFTVSGNWSNAGSFQPGTSSVTFTDGCSPTTTLSGNTTFYDLAFITTVGKHFLLTAGTTQTVLHSLTLRGTPAQPLVLASTNPSVPAYINPVTGASVVRDNAEVVDNAIIGPLPPIPTLSAAALLLLALLTLATGAFGVRRPARLRA